MLQNRLGLTLCLWKECGSFGGRVAGQDRVSAAYGCAGGQSGTTHLATNQDIAGKYPFGMHADE